MKILNHSSLPSNAPPIPLVPLKFMGFFDYCYTHSFFLYCYTHKHTQFFSLSIVLHTHSSPELSVALRVGSLRCLPSVFVCL